MVKKAKKIYSIFYAENPYIFKFTLVYIAFKESKYFKKLPNKKRRKIQNYHNDIIQKMELLRVSVIKIRKSLSDINNGWENIKKQYGNKVKSGLAYNFGDSVYSLVIDMDAFYFELKSLFDLVAQFIIFIIPSSIGGQINSESFHKQINDFINKKGRYISKDNQIKEYIDYLEKNLSWYEDLSNLRDDNAHWSCPVLEFYKLKGNKLVPVIVNKSAFKSLYMGTEKELIKELNKFIDGSINYFIFYRDFFEKYIKDKYY